MQHVMVWSLLLLILVSCGGTTDVTQTPEAIHVRWLAAVRANDRAARWPWWMPTWPSVRSLSIRRSRPCRI